MNRRGAPAGAAHPQQGVLNSVPAEATIEVILTKKQKCSCKTPILAIGKTHTGAQCVGLKFLNLAGVAVEDWEPSNKIQPFLARQIGEVPLSIPALPKD